MKIDLNYPMNSTSKEQFRALFPHTKTDHIYLNHAAISPLSADVTQALKSFNEDRNSGTVENFESWMETVDVTRNLIADFIHTDSPERITFMGNTSDAISAIAEGLLWKKGDEIILNSMEFPSNVQPFRILERFGVKVIYLKPDEQGRITPEQIDEAISRKTRLVSISAVQYLNGFRADLKSIGKICRRRNVLFVVDGIQALGAVDVDVTACNIDALATGAHKWLMAPMGIGFLYISEVMEKQLSPAKTGWLSVEVPWDLKNFNQPWLPVSEHLETGTLNIAGIIGLNTALKNFMAIGIEHVESNILSLIDDAIAFLRNHPKVIIITPADAADHAGIISFSVNGMDSPDNFVKSLSHKKITISAREGFIRISPHYYNTTDEIETVLDRVLES
ncbi:MAG: aminotransferase class V-fold PLP-dependent enzyme [Balneolaceae bacterium]|nr:MAG: aminotransferase class V-fold PLP-dependent enzyme [Balneolaceae bacterium]